MRAPIEEVTVIDTPDRIAALRSVADDVRAAGAIASLVTTEGDELAVEVALAP
jgi:hypothetical protein